MSDYMNRPFSQEDAAHKTAMENLEAAPASATNGSRPNPSPVDWYEVLKDAATEAKFINRMSMFYLDTFARAIRAKLSAVSPNGKGAQP